MDNNYIPQPLETSVIELHADMRALTEQLARNVHEAWAAGRIADGWQWGEVRDDSQKHHPCLVPYDQLSESERDYDRRTAMQTIRTIEKLGFQITKKE